MGQTREYELSLLRQIIRETSIFILPMKWVHLVERDEEAILYPESLGFLVSGIDEEGESGSFSGCRLSSFWIRRGRLFSGSCILLLHLWYISFFFHPTIYLSWISANSKSKIKWNPLLVEPSHFNFTLQWLRAHAKNMNISRKVLF